MPVIALSVCIERYHNFLEKKLINDHFVKFKVNAAGDELQKIKCTFWENYDTIQLHNERYRRGLESYEQEVNQFTHLSDEERIKHYGLVDKTDGPPKTRVETADESGKRRLFQIPDSFDWRNSPGVVKPVYNQGLCGSCYVFAGIASLEGAMRVKFGIDVKLSEMEAMHCLNCCHGGALSDVFKYSLKKGGAAYYSDSPYKSNLPHVCEAPSTCFTDRRRVPNSISYTWYHAWSLFGSNVENMKYYLIEYGPLAVGFRVYESFDYYKSGIYDLWSDEPGQKNFALHAVLLVGYGTDDQGRDFWILKNSWGDETFLS